MIETVCLLFIVFAAAFIQGLTGFGFGLIALPLLGFFIPIKTVIPFMLMLAIFICLALTIQLRHAIRWKTVGVLSIATLPGIAIGIHVLKTVPPQPLALGLGILLITFTSYQLLAKPTPRELGLPYMLIAGFGCGLLTACISAGGPPAIIYASTQTWSKDETKGTLACYFLFGGAATVVSHALAGIITSDVLAYFTQSLPALALGILAGTIAYKHLSDHGYKKLTFILVFLIGCIMVYKNS